MMVRANFDILFLPKIQAHQSSYARLRDCFLRKPSRSKAPVAGWLTGWPHKMRFNKGRLVRPVDDPIADDHPDGVPTD